MFKFLTRMFRKKAASQPEPYALPSDDPETTPILIEENGEVALAEVSCLNSKLLAPVDPADPAGWSVRTRAVVEMKNGLTDLASHVRGLGQRLQAQTMGQSRLIEALANLPQMLREVIPNGEEQTRALAAMKLALDDQCAANRQFVEALKPLPEFVQAAANLPETARKQMWALNELTRQLEQGNVEAQRQSDEVKVMVETLTTQNAARTDEMKGLVDQMTKYQRAGLKQAFIANKQQEAVRKSQRRHHAELEHVQSAKLASIQKEQARQFAAMEDHLTRSAKRQSILAGAAVAVAAVAVALVVLVATGVIRVGDSTQGVAATEAVRHVPDAVVQR